MTEGFEEIGSPVSTLCPFLCPNPGFTSTVGWRKEENVLGESSHTDAFVKSFFIPSFLPLSFSSFPSSFSHSFIHSFPHSFLPLQGIQVSGTCPRENLVQVLIRASVNDSEMEREKERERESIK